MGPKLSETVKGKLSLGARIIQQGGRENIFRKVFGMSSSDGEKLLKASQCYLSTTAGPIAGILFISTHKLSFCSERSIILSSNSTPGEVVRTPYKVIISLPSLPSYLLYFLLVLFLLLTAGHVRTIPAAGTKRFPKISRLRPNP